MYDKHPVLYDNKIGKIVQFSFVFVIECQYICAHVTIIYYYIILFMKRYTTRELEQTQFDKDTGMPVQSTKQKFIVHDTDREEFICTYLEYVKWLFHINSLIQVQVLAYMAYKADFNEGTFDMSTDHRNYLMSELGVDTTAISRALRKLLESGVIKRSSYVDANGVEREAKSRYVINPTLLWKGDMNNRKKLIVTFTSVSEGEEFPLGGPVEVRDALK